MNKKKLKKAILVKIAQLETEIKEIKKLVAPIEPENAIGRISRMDAINNKTINDRLLRNAAEKLKKLKLALSRIGEPKFGFCALCEQAIQEARLMLTPESSLCISCARRA
tara:strand:+ start:101 stop:430 length:330 start_codon:yes stop_codon:yes gene_type:complete